MILLTPLYPTYHRHQGWVIDWLWILQYLADTEVDLPMENAFFTADWSAEVDEETEGFLLSFMLNLSSTLFS
ncbi:hypothetical protein OIU84_023208 [Salix udensis]|uniref:Uncharacterized protein n=1 Tax=Salix udensis TaxID=889485 RepID=A0AAD6KSL3_9ROSI|nr:hypothetical protein OIU84_023208 [Salix udensis]